MFFLEASEKYRFSGSRREGIMWLGKSPRQNLIIGWDPDEHLSLGSGKDT